MDSTTFDEFGTQGGSICTQLIVSYWQDISTGQLMTCAIIGNGRVHIYIIIKPGMCWPWAGTRLVS